MPGRTPERTARLTVAYALSQKCQKIGRTFLDYQVALDEKTLTVTLYCYSVGTNDPEKVYVEKITDAAMVRLAHKGGNPPEPRDPEKTVTQEPKKAKK